jgi:death-on-curing protein
LKILSGRDVIDIHEHLIDINELQGMAGNKSIDAVLGRIDTRLAYGMIDDVFDLAACYACFLAVGHVFNDANKRTAFACMDVSLSMNGVNLTYDAREVGDLVIKTAQGIVDERELGAWLRTQAR